MTAAATTDDRTIAMTAAARTAAAEDELLDVPARLVLRSLQEDDGGGNDGNDGGGGRLGFDLLDDAGAAAASSFAGPSPSDSDGANGAVTAPSDLEEVHANESIETDASNNAGHQGGQHWNRPSRRPSPLPTPLPTPTSPPTLGTRPPTASPTGHPTLSGQLYMLRGIVWYDRNSNGRRDSNVEVAGMGEDVEYSHGVGGVNVRLVQCDETTGRATSDGPATTTAVTQGFDNRMIPQVVRSGDANAKYNLFITGLEKWYYVHVEAPQGYRFTSGICNDGVRGWECDYDAITDAIANPSGGIARGEGQPGERAVAPARGASDADLGIPAGRSASCVYVDARGEVTSPLNFGIMREGETQWGVAQVALLLRFDGSVALPASPTFRGRRGRDLLDRRDRDSIGTVAAEILAANLDESLSEYGIVLEVVDPKEVIVSDGQVLAGGGDGGASSAAAPGSQLAVSMEIRGHYSPPPYIDFEEVVQKSINRDTVSIRRGLRDYNDSCRKQRAKMDAGVDRKEEFGEVVSARGRREDGRGGGVFSTACDEGVSVPRYFETELDDVEALEVSAVGFRDAVDAVWHRAAEDARTFEEWALGPVVGIAGLIVLLLGALVFRRALGPRRAADVYSEGRRTLKLDKDETRRFGEAREGSDDGSVDSAFYSDPDDDDDDADLEETEKERKIRRKRKEKGEAQRRGGGDRDRPSRAKSSRKKGGPSSSSSGGGGGGGRDRASRKKKEGKLAVSHGSDDTESLGKISNDSEEAADKSGRSGRGDGKRPSGKDRSEKKLSSKGKRDRDRDASDRRRERRGRNKRSGGDNARAHEEAQIV